MKLRTVILGLAVVLIVLLTAAAINQVGRWADAAYSPSAERAHNTERQKR